MDTTIDGWYFGNLIFGGLVGMLIIDPITGAMWKIDREFVHETLSPVVSGIQRGDTELEIYQFSEVSTEWHSKMQRLR